MRREVKEENMKTHQQILHASCWLALALSVQAFVLTALAQSPLPDSFNPGADNNVRSLVVQADGKILVGGGFTTLAGQSGTNIDIGRLSSDGTLDQSFNLGYSARHGSAAFSLAGQADGKILVGGNFSTLGGQSRDYMGRLNADGTLDTSFDPGVDYFVNSLAVQADRKSTRL